MGACRLLPERTLIAFLEIMGRRRCRSAQGVQPMRWSSCASGVYQMGWSCENCEACGAAFSSHGAWRWLCTRCSRDLCQACAFSGPPPSHVEVARPGCVAILGCGRSRGAVAQPDARAVATAPYPTLLQTAAILLKADDEGNVQKRKSRE